MTRPIPDLKMRIQTVAGPDFRVAEANLAELIGTNNKAFWLYTKDQEPALVRETDNGIVVDVSRGTKSHYEDVANRIQNDHHFWKCPSDGDGRGPYD